MTPTPNTPTGTAPEKPTCQYTLPNNEPCGLPATFIASGIVPLCGRHASLHPRINSNAVVAIENSTPIAPAVVIENVADNKVFGIIHKAICEIQPPTSNINSDVFVRGVLKALAAEGYHISKDEA